MKKILLILLAICTTTIVNSQSISTQMVQYCDWDSANKQWKDCATNNNYNSLMVINDQQTMITHTTEDNKSIYYVESTSIVYNDLKEKEWVYNLTSDTGTKYIMKINPTSRLIFCVYTVEGEIKETIFMIKSIF